ncbi:cobalt ECF transporter T component CbiQ [Candidatus Omnitrophota bacterium]
MHLEEFSQGDSLFHKIDPRIKIVVFLPLVFVVALLQSIVAGIISLLFAVLCIILARISLRPLLNRLIVVNIFIVFLWLTLPFSIEGKVLFSFAGLDFSRQGLIYALAVTLKANAILFFTVSILGTSEIFSLAHALFHLKAPKKLVYLFFFFYRYISVLHREYDKLLSAVKMRAFSPRTDFHTFKTYGYLVGMLFVNSYERSQRIYQALVLRGFRGDFPLLSHFQLRKKDLLFAIVMFSITVSLLMIWK